MKKLMMIAAMMTAVLSANAQFEPGTWSIQPKIGGTITKVSNMPKITNIDFGELGVYDLNVDRDLYAGGLIGAEVEYQVSKKFSVAAGANYAMQGCKWADFKVTSSKGTADISDLQVELNYINVPIVANYYIFKGFAVKTGVQLGFLTSAKRSAKGKTVQGNVTTTMKEDEDIMDECNKFDVAIPVGVSYQIPTFPLYIDARYNIGLKNISKGSSQSIKNQVFQVTVGWKFKL